MELFIGTWIMFALVNLELLKLALIDALNPVTYRAVSQGDGSVRTERVPEDERYLRSDGKDWPLCAATMVGEKRLANIEQLLRSVVAERVQGDFIETGVWRGGASIFARAVLNELDSARGVWLCDSFEGLPKPNADFPADAGDLHHLVDFLAASKEEVEANFVRFKVYGRVLFKKGWFSDTLPELDGQWAVLRLDGDMYESTMVALESLYPQVSSGGYVIVDDYGAVAGCRQAVADFRERERITEPIERIDWTGVYWRVP